MAHAAKYGSGASGHLTAHYERKQIPVKNENGETVMQYIKFNNQDIDLSRTHLNYNLAPEREIGQTTFLQKRLSEIKVQKRADVNVMCDWVVTMPKVYKSMNKDIHVTPNKEYVEKLFFERTYQFLADRYGEKNVISAYVHMDEKSPHMHFAFVPVVPDTKWNEKHPEAPREKLSAKEVLTRADLRTFHTDLEKHLDSFHDWHYEVLNEATKEGNKSIEELKRGTAVEDVAKARKEADKEIQQIRSEVSMERRQAETTKSDLKAEIADLERRRDGILTSLEVNQIKGEKTVFGGLKGVSYTEFESLKKTAAMVDDALQKVASAEARIKQAYADATSQLQTFRKADNEVLKEKEKALYQEYSEKTNKVMWRNDRLERENKQLRSEVSKLTELVDYMKSMIKQKLPEMVKTLENRIAQMSKERDSGHQR